MLLGEGADTADSATDDYADAVGVGAVRSQAGLTASLLGGHGGKLGEAVHPPGFLAVKVILGVESFDLGGEVGVEALRVKGGDVIHPGPAVHDTVPSRRHVESKWAHDPHSGDQNPMITTHMFPSPLTQTQARNQADVNHDLETLDQLTGPVNQDLRPGVLYLGRSPPGGTRHRLFY